VLRWFFRRGRCSIDQEGSRMVRALARFAFVFALFAAFAAPAWAGGMATVHLDAPPQNVVVGVPVEIGMMVMQHDITPVNVDRVVVSATHRQTGQTYTVDARQDGPAGHYLAELTFPQAGSWKWMITPEPFAGTSFASIQVQDAAGSTASDASSAHPATIRAGSCQALGETSFPLSDVLPNGVVLDGKTDQTTGVVGVDAGVPVAISATTVDVTIAELLAEPHAIIVVKDAGTEVACGNISGRIWNSELIVGLQQRNNSSDVGIAVLREAAGKTTVSLYMMVVATEQAAATGPEVTVEITGSSGDWRFEPARVEIAPGTTVVWVNKTETSHTVTGTDLAFEDSSPIAPGETFREVFTDPGDFRYFCSPHPYMTGVVVVTEPGS
jgi:plastocyanin